MRSLESTLQDLAGIGSSQAKWPCYQSLLLSLIHNSSLSIGLIHLEYKYTKVPPFKKQTNKKKQNGSHLLFPCLPVITCATKRISIRSGRTSLRTSPPQRTEVHSITTVFLKEVVGPVWGVRIWGRKE